MSISLASLPGLFGVEVRSFDPRAGSVSAVDLIAGTNPRFFEGTAIQEDVAKHLLRAQPSSALRDC